MINAERLVYTGWGRPWRVCEARVLIFSAACIVFPPMPSAAQPVGAARTSSYCLCSISKPICNLITRLFPTPPSPRTYSNIWSSLAKHDRFLVNITWFKTSCITNRCIWCNGKIAWICSATVLQSLSKGIGSRLDCSLCGGITAVSCIYGSSISVFYVCCRTPPSIDLRLVFSSRAASVCCKRKSCFSQCLPITDCNWWNMLFYT